MVDPVMAEYLFAGPTVSGQLGQRIIRRTLRVWRRVHRFGRGDLLRLIVSTCRGGGVCRASRNDCIKRCICPFEKAYFLIQTYIEANE